MEDPIQISLIRHHNTPVFAIRDDHTDLVRVYGCTRIPRLKLALFPAFLPFADHVIQDLEIVFGAERLQWSEAADEQRVLMLIDKQNRANDTLPEGFSFHTEPFAHQREGLLNALYAPRHALLFDCGLGKTKAAIDLIRAVKCIDPDVQTLVLAPPHLVPNWVDEFGVHDDGSLSVVALVGDRGKSLPPAKRREHYAGARKKNPPSSSPYAKEYPDVLYTPMAPEVAASHEEFRELEYAYVAATNDVDADGQNLDPKHRSRLRAAMRKYAKEHDLEMPDSARWIAPPPAPVKDYDVFVAAYTTASTDLAEIISSFPHAMLICDESHLLRGTKSARTQAALQLGARAYRRVILSGTPSLGTPMHLYAQLTLLGSFITESWWKFYRRYSVTVRQKVGQRSFNQTVGFRALNVLNEIVTEVATRKTADECLDLPPVRTIKHPIQVSDETRDIYNDFVRTSATEVAGRQVRTAHAADRLSKLMQVLSGFYIDSQKNYELCTDCPHLLDCAKLGIQPYTDKCAVVSESPPKITEFLKATDRLDQTMDLLDSILTSPKNKVIIWAVYSAEIDMICGALDSSEWDYVRVDGKTKDKEAAKKRFNNVESCRVYVSQIRTGVGITLNAANYTIFYNATFDLGDYIQAQKRNDRIGQQRPVTVYQLVVPGSVNEYIFRSLEKKENIADSLTNHIQCMLCERNAQCERDGVKPFDEDCIYDSSATVHRARPALLK